jgi:hypothetical protein
MNDLDRTKQGALQTLLKLLEELQEDDDEAKQTTSESLLRDVFDIAWHFQFEEDRRPSRREVRELVQDAALAAKLGERE